MAVNKIIKFYVIEPQPSLNFDNRNGLLNKYTLSIFKSAFVNGEDYYSINYDKKNLFFDIKEFNENYMFGTCSVIEDIQATSFMQQRNKSTNKTKPFTTVNNDEQLESYTFFYIDFVFNRMAVIANKKISKIHEALSNFIWEKSGHMASASIYPERVDDAKEIVSLLRDWSHLQLEYYTPKSIQNIESIKKSLGSDFTIEKYKLDMKLKDVKPSFIDNLFKYKNNAHEEGISKFNVIGKNELGVDETINLIETIYTKTVPLQLTNDTAINIEYIKNKLYEFLSIHLGNMT